MGGDQISGGGVSLNEYYKIAYISFYKPVDFAKIEAVEWNGERIELTISNGIAMYVDAVTDK